MNPAGTGRSKARSLVFGLLAAAIGTVLALATGELLVRGFATPTYRLPVGTSGAFVLGMGVDLRASYEFEEGGKKHVVEYTTNSLGFRDREHLPGKPQGVRRIAILGDSFVAGLAVAQDAIFPRRVEEILRQKGHPVEVISCGVVGYSTALELLVLREKVAPLEPDVVVISFFQNDPWDNTPGLSTSYAPYFRETPEGRLEILEPEAAGVSRPSPVSTWLNENLKLYSWQKERVRTLTEWYRFRFRQGPKALPKVYHPLVEPPLPRTEDAWKLTLRLLDEIKAETERLGATLMVLDIPLQEAVSPSRLAVSKERFPELARSRIDWDRSSTYLGIWAKKRGVSLLDLRVPLRVAGDAASLYLQFDGHFSEAGHQRVGSILAEALERGLTAGDQIRPRQMP